MEPVHQENPTGSLIATAEMHHAVAQRVRIALGQPALGKAGGAGMVSHHKPGPAPTSPLRKAESGHMR